MWDSLLRILIRPVLEEVLICMRMGVCYNAQAVDLLL